MLVILNTEIVTKTATRLGLEFVAEKDLTGFSNLSGIENRLENQSQGLGYSLNISYKLAQICNLCLLTGASFERA